MPRLSAFTPCGHLTLSGRHAHGQDIYEQLRAGMSPDKGYTTAWDSNVQATLYARAMAVASAQYTLERAGNQNDPRTATEMLPELERDFRAVPGPFDTAQDRRDRLAVKVLASRGARRESVEDALTTALGDGFRAYLTTDTADAAVDSAAPGDVGNFVAPGTPPKVVRLTNGASITGLSSTVAYELLLGEALQVGETLCVDPDPGQTRTERVTVTALGSGTLTTTFQHGHDVDTVGTAGYAPVWTSTKRHALVVLSDAAAVDAESRRVASETMARMVRGVSTWDVCDDSGPFKVGVGRLGVTTIGAVTV